METPRACYSIGNRSEVVIRMIDRSPWIVSHDDDSRILIDVFFPWLWESLAD
jgi:hypothetical protein